MTNTLIRVLIGALSFAPRSLFDEVAANRLAGLTAYPLTHDPSGYECLVGVPVGFEDLIDTEVWFDPDRDGAMVGPWLVVDVQHPQALDMQANGLMADVTCPEYVHQKGKLIAFNLKETERIP